MLDALLLLSSSASGSLSKALSSQGGMASILTREKTDNIVFAIEVDRIQSFFSYNLHIASQGVGHTISREVLSQKVEGDEPVLLIDSCEGDIALIDAETKNLRPIIAMNDKESFLSMVDERNLDIVNFRHILKSVCKYHILDVGPRAPIKLPQQIKPAGQLGANGEDLVSFLFSLREGDRSRYEAIEDTLKVAFPGFESLNFPPVAAGMLAMTWKDRHYSNPFFMNELSEGTLRFLWLVSLLQSPVLPTITMIDEPEVSLHPELLNILADLMREASGRTNLVIATHSDRFISFLKPEEVVVMDSDEDGFATASWADTLDLDEWLKEYSLDEVWRLGRMGGRS
jgi:predicted ATPase